jgi:hypothetical protein
MCVSAWQAPQHTLTPGMWLVPRTPALLLLLLYRLPVLQASGGIGQARGRCWRSASTRKAQTC